MGYFFLFPKALVAFSKLYYDEIVYIATMELIYNVILMHVITNIVLKLFHLNYFYHYLKVGRQTKQ